MIHTILNVVLYAAMIAAIALMYYIVHKIGKAGK